MNRLLAGRHILLVEDEILVLLMLEGMLEDLGCTSMLSAATNEAALALLEDHTFDAAVLDIKLDGKSSHPVAEALAIIGTPFVYATGSSVAEIEGGFQDRPLLRKPFKFEDFASTVGGLLRL